MEVEKHPYNIVFSFKEKEEGQRKFRCYNEAELVFLRRRVKFPFFKNYICPQLQRFPLFDLEEEYDYESDLE